MFLILAKCKRMNVEFTLEIGIQFVWSSPMEEILMNRLLQRVEEPNNGCSQVFWASINLASPRSFTWSLYIRFVLLTNRALGNLKFLLFHSTKHKLTPLLVHKRSNKPFWNTTSVTIVMKLGATQDAVTMKSSHQLTLSMEAYFMYQQHKFLLSNRPTSH